MIKNIVLVHGAFADGSSWRHVIPLLHAQGCRCTAVQQPLTSLEEDVAITRHILKLQDGPCILVGHSYGGAIITEAGNAPNVMGLVYVAAFAPDEGENLADLKAKASPAPGSAFVHVDDQGYAWIDRSAFRASFAEDVDLQETEVMAAVQMPWKVPTTRITDPAWRKVPSWYQISERDQMINPELQRFMARRMVATTISLDASHASAISCPRPVAELIAAAAKATVHAVVA